MFVVGITGGIGSGKTTVSDLFSDLGVKVIDADISARSIVEPGQTALTEIEQVFGDSVIQADGCLDRHKLREIIFADTGKRLQLEAITHPAIRQNMLAQLNTCDDPYAILVLPLLVDTGQWEMMIDRILVVDIDEQTQRQRVMQRDNLSVEQVNQILDAQVSRIERLGAADDILLNNHGLEHLQEKVAHYHGVYSLMATEGSDAVPA
jgi:dephospho-CoA kinase